MRTGVNCKYTHEAHELLTELKKMRELRHLKDEDYAEILNYGGKNVLVERYDATSGWVYPEYKTFYNPQDALDTICYYKGYSCVFCGVVNKHNGTNEAEWWSSDWTYFGTGFQYWGRVRDRVCPVCRLCRMAFGQFSRRKANRFVRIEDWKHDRDAEVLNVYIPSFLVFLIEQEIMAQKTAGKGVN